MTQVWVMGTSSWQLVIQSLRSERGRAFGRRRGLATFSHTGNHSKNTAISWVESQHDLRQLSALRSAASLPCWRWQLLIRVWIQVGGRGWWLIGWCLTPEAKWNRCEPKKSLVCACVCARGMSRPRESQLNSVLWREAESASSEEGERTASEVDSGGKGEGSLVRSEGYLSWHLSGLQQERWVKQSASCEDESRGKVIAIK